MWIYGYYAQVLRKTLNFIHNKQQNNSSYINNQKESQLANTCKVLEKVNAALAVAGRPLLDDLPRGYVGSSKDCPLARALRPLDGVNGVSVGGGSASGINKTLGSKIAFAMGGKYESGTLLLPPELSQFVRDFDAGRHPEYNAKY